MSCDTGQRRDGRPPRIDPDVHEVDLTENLGSRSKLVRLASWTGPCWLRLSSYDAWTEYEITRERMNARGVPVRVPERYRLGPAGKMAWVYVDAGETVAVAAWAAIASADTDHYHPHSGLYVTGTRAARLVVHRFDERGDDHGGEVQLIVPGLAGKYTDGDFTDASGLADAEEAWLYPPAHARFATVYATGSIVLEVLNGDGYGLGAGRMGEAIPIGGWSGLHVTANAQDEADTMVLVVWSV